MNRHKASVHDQTKPSKCDICGYSSSQKGDLKKHIASVYEEDKFEVTAIQPRSF